MSRSPYDPAPLEGVGEGEMQFSQVKSQATGPETSVSELLHLGAQSCLLQPLSPT